MKTITGKTCKVSVIVPIYNVSKYIERCVQSVINQRYSNFECILVDDASPDDSISKAESMIFATTDPIKFKILRHSANKGLSAARNTGTEKATGDYIFYLDSDDEIPKDSIETLTNMAKKYPDVEIVQGNTLTLPTLQPRDDWRNIKYKNFPEFVSDNNWVREKFSSLNARKDIPMNACNKLIKHSFLKQNNFSFKEGIIHEDELWMFQVTRKLKNIAFTQKYTYHCYVSPDSITQSIKKCDYKSVKSWAVILSEIYSNAYILSEKEKEKYNYVLTTRYEKAKKYDELYPCYKKLIATLGFCKPSERID